MPLSFCALSNLLKVLTKHSIPLGWGQKRKCLPELFFGLPRVRRKRLGHWVTQQCSRGESPKDLMLLEEYAHNSISPEWLEVTGGSKRGLITQYLLYINLISSQSLKVEYL